MQNQIIERFNCEEQITIKKSSNKIVFSTALILAHKMVHFKVIFFKFIYLFVNLIYRLSKYKSVLI